MAAKHVMIGSGTIPGPREDRSDITDTFKRTSKSGEGLEVGDERASDKQRAKIVELLDTFKKPEEVSMHGTRFTLGTESLYHEEDTEV